MFVDLVDSEDVLKAVRARGPMIPLEIRKFLGKGDSITIGAELSTLLKKGLVKSTKVKMGGSPFYYVRGQENKLELLYKYLNDKDKRVFEQLREEKIMKDSSQEPLTRVSLRNLPDFAKKIELENNNGTILYWRWYMINEEDAINLIRGNAQKRKIETEEEPEPQKETEQTTEPKEEKTETEPQKETEPQPEIKKQEKPEPQKQKEPETKPKEEQQTIPEEIPEYDDEFFKQLNKFFNKNDIKIKSAKMIRKNSDYEFIVEMKTPFGNTEYFCKAKSKKKCNEGDLSSAYLQGQNKRMPTVFITSGEITKKAKSKAKEEYKGLLFKEL